MDTSPFVPSRAALEEQLRGATGGDIVLVVQQSLRVGAPRTGIAVCEVARALGVSDPAVVLAEATARFAVGERERALGLVEAVLTTLPEHLVALNLKAHMLIPLSRGKESLEIFSRVVERFPDFPGAQGALSSLLLPGPPYRDVLARIHAILRPDTYLEIGVETGATLALATTASAIAGVDPEACSSPRLLPPAARFYEMESDAFFRDESPATVFGGRPVDLTFIDGMHWFEYALRDFANAEHWAAHGGTIVLHDCLPATRIAAARERASEFWVGDTWKALEALLDYRPDLRITIIPTAPSGLVVVRGLDPRSTVLFSEMNAIVRRYRDREYPFIAGEWPERRGVVTNDEAGLAQALR